MSTRRLIKNGCVLTMDSSLGTLRKADILIEDSLIVTIQADLDVSDSEVIDATDMIVMPGFVDTHRHVWESLLRTIGADWSLPAYLQSIYYGGLGSRLRPADSYAANLLGALEALNAGVTTVLDWTMIYSPDHADELIRGLRDSGMRAVFAYGVSGETDYWSRDSQKIFPEDVYRVKKEYFASDDQLLTMGLAIRGPEFSSWEATVREIGLARELGALCSMHVGFGSWGADDRSVEKLYKAGLLGPDLNMVHANTMGFDEYKLLADAGASLSVTPEVEMMMGHGYPATGHFLENGGTPALGVDVVTSTGGDMFTQMKFALQAERARVNQDILASKNMPGELNLQAGQVLHFATAAGAKALRLDHKIGTLAPGKEADLILIRTTDLNLFPVSDPIGAVVQFANPGNVDAVFVAGRPVKRHGRLLNVDLNHIRKLANESRQHLLASSAGANKKP
ncbi:MAG: amidohydrolase family protein [Paenibacillus macerans]|uniref:amidohydrolase family protein n=1 Tax=Paenibacillus macerans TaxID=44252 RepID=UPI001B2C6623|nr:amidohydrolase family protein [Paenibacillus macerans]MBS5910912.1 amidohydrolase family protein [Paenibacillus macerans]MDU7477908.1 amidohydrolase family protein [Paenibacillus macerans]UMV46452.1 amidohydrolase family protein [Paenibacillus macerans]GIP07917.1 TRZ/ATZ family hydrolase [Paenibacillus macerans]